MIAIKTSKAVHSMESGLTLTPYVNDKGEIMLASEGNGCGDDVPLNDIFGWTHDDIEREYGLDRDVDAMRADADEIAAAGDADSADWLRSWCDDYEALRDNA